MGFLISFPEIFRSGFIDSIIRMKYPFVNKQLAEKV